MDLDQVSREVVEAVSDAIERPGHQDLPVTAVRKVLAEHLSNGDVLPRTERLRAAPADQDNVTELRGRDRIQYEGQPIANIQVRAIPYDGDVYIASKDIIALAQTLQSAGEGFQSLITHLLPYTMASQLIVGPESSDG